MGPGGESNKLRERYRSEAATSSVEAVYEGLAPQARTSNPSVNSCGGVAKLQAELDGQKQATLEYLKAYMTLEIDERNRALESYKEFIRSVQILRDKMSRVVQFPDSYRPDLLDNELRDLAGKVSEAYASNQVFLATDNDRCEAHELKNDCLLATQTLKQFVQHPDDSVLEELQKLLKSLAEKQDHLRMRARHSADLFIAEAKERIVQGKGRDPQ